jgi:DNA mismatch repair protein MutS
LAAKVKNNKETPLMRQYTSIKQKYEGALVLFRVGDFYETFNDDARIASSVLGIVLTKRANGKASHVDLAGFPHHSLDTYLPRLVRAGYRVAICDQLEAPSKEKKIVKRGVTELVTPGVTVNDKVLNAKQSNYLAAVFEQKNIYGVAFLDISTGEFMLAEGHADYISKLLAGLQPSEILFSKKLKTKFQNTFGSSYYTFMLDDWILDYEFGFERLTRQFGVKNLKGFGIEDQEHGITAAGACLYYLEQTHHNMLDHIRTISRIEEDRYVWMDQFTVKNLEIIYSNHPDGKCLLDVLDHTKTPMGGRKLRKWTVLPLKDVKEIQHRLDRVEYLIGAEDEHNKITDSLRQIGDLERLVSKLSVLRINPREIVQLGKSIAKTQEIIEIAGAKSSKLAKMAQELHPAEDVLKRIESDIVESPPLLIHKGGIFKEGLNDDLDRLRKIAFSGKDYLVELRQREVANTGIPSLKIAFNNVFGYYIEVTNTHKDKVPETWIRKQTLVNAERYITEELKQYESQILNAEDEIVTIEEKMYQDFVLYLQESMSPLQNNAQLLAELDCLCSFAHISRQRDYCKPEISNSFKLTLNDSRHPVIELQLPRGEEYVPNDIHLNPEDQQLIILTGPNMSGKSALLRQTALAVLMAQMGCFVPAKHAEIGVVDKIYTRVGASDNISQGESTFMVEMTETASILNNLSSRSLILLDEIGRGTSTFDGVSLAWAIAEYIHLHETKAKTLFATHYHELNELESKYPGVVNYHVTTKEVGKKVIFLRKIKKGGSEHSFGIHVAQMAGMPSKVVRRASKILVELEKDRASISGKKTVKGLSEPDYQLQLFQINDPKLKQLLDEMSKIDTNAMTPIEALLKINELKDLLDD